MECMAIGGPSNNPLADLFKYNSSSGVAPKNQAEEVSSTETPTKIDSASKSSERIAQLRAEALGTDGFGGVVDSNTVEKTAGASSVGSIKFDKTAGIAELSALGEPSSVTAINNPAFSEIATSGNSVITVANQQLLLAAKMSQAGGISGDFQVSEESANLNKGNELLALVGNT